MFLVCRVDVQESLWMHSTLARILLPTVVLSPASDVPASQRYVHQFNSSIGHSNLFIIPGNFCLRVCASVSEWEKVWETNTLELPISHILENFSIWKILYAMCYMRISHFIIQRIINVAWSGKCHPSTGLWSPISRDHIIKAIPVAHTYNPNAG